MTDAELIKKTLDGQTSAFEVLVRRWSARLTAFVLSRVRRFDVAEDLAQECLLRSFRSLATLKSPERYGSWLFSIANMAAIDWLKAKARTEVSFEGGTNSPDSSSARWASDVPTPYDNCSRAEDDRRLMDEVMALPDSLREVILIYYYDDVTYKDMAEMLGVSTATINVRLTKARATLRDKLTTLGRST